MTNKSVSCQGLAKRYLIGHSRLGHASSSTFMESLQAQISGVFSSTRRALSGEALVAGNEIEEYWALKDVSFEALQGEMIGVIGGNGAGKSTLLKVLSRITEPTLGRVELTGRVSSLLEVGTGFHAELSGRENIFLNGAILGMSRQEIKSRFDEIVAFSGVEQFLDTPVKRYSSGMYVRLAFSVAAHLRTEVMIVDEVLAVGDMQFQQKCLGKMKSLGGEGRTIIFVSHNLNAVRHLCTRGLLIDKGSLEFDGDCKDAINHYLGSIAESAGLAGSCNWEAGELVSLSGAIQVDSVQVSTIRGTSNNGVFDAEEPIDVVISYTQSKSLPVYRTVLEFIGPGGALAFATTDHSEKLRQWESSIPSGAYETRCRIPAGLLNGGTYQVFMRMGVPGGDLLIGSTYVLSFLIGASSHHGSTYDSEWPGEVCPSLEWRVTSH